MISRQNRRKQWIRGVERSSSCPSTTVGSKYLDRSFWTRRYTLGWSTPPETRHKKIDAGYLFRNLQEDLWVFHWDLNVVWECNYSQGGYFGEIKERGLGEVLLSSLVQVTGRRSRDTERFPLRESRIEESGLLVQVPRSLLWVSRTRGGSLSRASSWVIQWCCPPAGPLWKRGKGKVNL